MRAPPAPATKTNLTVDAALLERWALFYLERYASSAENLRRVLRRRVRRRLGTADEGVGAADMAIDALVARYAASALVDDALYAAARARGGLARGRSSRRIAADLAAKGVQAPEITAALAGLRDAVADPDLAAACIFARRRRLGPFRRGGADAALRLRELAAFARAGFARRTAEAILACPDPTSAEELAAGNPGERTAFN